MDHNHGTYWCPSWEHLEEKHTDLGMDRSSELIRQREAKMRIMSCWSR